MTFLAIVLIGCSGGSDATSGGGTTDAAAGQVSAGTTSGQDSDGANSETETDSSQSDEPVDPPLAAVQLSAGRNSGHDSAWTSRPYGGKPTWGIRGSGYPEDGEIWFNSFPGASGEYQVTLGVYLEQDGSSSYAVRAGGRTLKDGRFPYYRGKRDCDARGGTSEIGLGRHTINQGERISVWGRSIYECGKHGAYALWYSMRFEPVM